MPKPADRPLSHYSLNAARLLGQLIRHARINRKLTASQLAERAGLSRGLLQRIERGDPGCAIGAVFEAAAIAGVPLFDADQETLDRAIAANAAMLTLMPKAVRTVRQEVKDDF
jgi:transcriptional regulator with XRE-family HTH domain